MRYIIELGTYIRLFGVNIGRTPNTVQCNFDIFPVLFLLHLAVHGVLTPYYQQIKISQMFQHNRSFSFGWMRCQYRFNMYVMELLHNFFRFNTFFL